METRFARILLMGAVLAGLIMSGWDGVSAEGEDSLPCAEEIAKYCSEIKPGGGRIIACLKEHENGLTDLCKDKIEKVAGRAKELEKACAADVERFCKDVQPGGGRIAKCLKEHKSELSAPCTGKLAWAKAMVR
ncbi:MAG TPA: cysteine rich repeat-containing protein [Dissulfurispiraceae bacterium]|nr:cysteine rich repeat-containing protein [Dissulfurispiraceae bacterium]